MVSHGKGSDHDFPIVFTVAVPIAVGRLTTSASDPRPIMLAGDERADIRSALRAILPALENLVPRYDDEHWGPIPVSMR
jgi:hypothetical protein